MNKQIGLSIVELLVALAVGAIITAGIAQIMSNQQASYQTQASLSRLNENGRFAQFFLQKSVRQAAYQGCRSAPEHSIYQLAQSLTPEEEMTAQNAVVGYGNASGQWSPELPAWVKDHIPSETHLMSNSDAITLRQFNPINVRLTQPMANGNAPLHVTNNQTIQIGDLVYIADCDLANSFRVSLGTTQDQIEHKSPENQSAALSKAYGLDAKLGKLSTKTYYVRSSTRRNQSGQIINVLASLDQDGQEAVLFEGVDRLSIRYGIDNNNDHVADTFLNAKQVEQQAAWGKVVVVEMALLLNSVEAVGKAEHSYQFLGQRYFSNDRLIRRQWTVNTALRNRLL